MRGVELLVGIGVGLFLGRSDYVRSSFTAANLKEISVKVAQNAGPALKHTLAFTAAALTTFICTSLVLALVMRRIYPIDGSGKVIQEDYQKLSTSEKAGRALALTVSGAATGALLGKFMTSALCLNPCYFRNTTVALAGLGASTGGFVAGVFHFIGTVESSRNR